MSRDRKSYATGVSKNYIYNNSIVSLVAPILIFFLSLFAPFTVSAQSVTPLVSRVVPLELAQCLSQKGWVMYGKPECSACAIEKEYFGESFSQISYVDCREQIQLCEEKNIRAFPTWEDADGKKYRGAIPLDVLGQLSGCSEVETIASASSTTLTRSQMLSAFLAGLLSFLAPCLIPLLPAYFSVITGFTFKELYGLDFERIRGRVFLSVLFFVLGFSLVFTILGATGSLVGQLLSNVLPILLRFNGVVLILLGLFQVGVLKMPSWEFDYAWSVQRKLRNLGFVTAWVTGVAAALSWIPCVGPLLSSVLLVSSQQSSVAQGALLLFIYSMGLTLPFIAAGLYFPHVVRTMQEKRVLFHRLSIGGGVVLILFGIILTLGQYRFLVEKFYSLFR